MHMRPNKGPSRRAYAATQGRRVLHSKRGYYALSINAVSSLGNFAVSLSLARQLPISELGLFATAYSLYALSSGLMRAAILEPSLAIPNTSRSTARVSILGLVIGAILTVLGLLASSPYFLFLGLAMHGLLVYDYMRTYEMASGNARRALSYECCWFVASVAISFAVTTLAITGWEGFAIWAASGALLGYVYALARRAPLRPRWQKEGGPRFKTSCAFGLDYLVGSGSAQFTTSLLAVIVGPAIVGGIRAAATLLGPIGLVIATARTLMIPLLARENRSEERRSILLAVLMTAILSALTLPFLVLVALLPVSVGTDILGANWSFAEPLLPLLAIESFLLVLSIAPFAGLRSLLAARRTLVTRICLAILRVGCIVAAGQIAGALGACLAIAGIAAVSAVVWWIAYIRANKLSSKLLQN